MPMTAVSLDFDSIDCLLGFGFLAFLEQSKSDIVNYKVYRFYNGSESQQKVCLFSAH